MTDESERRLRDQQVRRVLDVIRKERQIGNTTLTAAEHYARADNFTEAIRLRRNGNERLRRAQRASDLLEGYDFK